MIKNKRSYKRTFNACLIKIGKCYSVKDIQLLFGVSKRTISAWVKEGLRPISNTKPYLFHWAELKRFITERQIKRKPSLCQTHQLNEIYCLHCRVYRQSLNNKVEIRHLNETKLRIIGVCSACGKQLSKLDAIAKLPAYKEVFDTS